MSYLCAPRYAALTGLAIVATQSRTTGVGPLAVKFSTIGTTQAGVTHPFHDLRYWWDFGAGVTGTWAVDGSLKRYATGPVASCVFPVGTHNPVLTVFNGLAFKTFVFDEITVTDPDAVFAGAATYVVATDGDFTGKPTGATEITSSDFDSVVNTNLAVNRRILFKRGQTFETSTAAAFNVAGPWIVGAWGTGDKPIVARTGGGTMFQIGSSGSNWSDGRIMDLTLDGDETVALVGVNGSGNVDNLLFSGVDIIDAGSGFSLPATAANLHHIWKHIFFYECDVSGLLNDDGGVGFFLWLEDSAVMGCTVNDTSLAEHCFRTMYTNRFVLWKNEFVEPAATKACITMRAPDFDSAVGPLPAGTYSNYTYVAGNKCVGGTGVTWPANFGPDNASDARLRNFIVEDNYIPMGTGAAATVLINVFSGDATGPITVRNNIGDASGIANNFTGIGVTKNGTGPAPTGVNVYNNTIYTADATITMTGVRLDADITGCAVQNNLISAPNAGTVTAINDLGSGNTVEDNSTTEQAEGVAPFVDSTPTAPADFAPAGYAVGGGDNTLPVFDNYFSDLRGYGNSAPIMNVGAV